ncbi:AAA family ATPase [Adlercreutzia sp. ZJ141]|uniref:AAA family ATPase n=1 Tax=Adlercreutzia sp. ZJ141 TaxID=2709406 RepID=UPI0013EDAEE3|nr:AAA family ATPase [Adlercreutzia sp. ZJ141]
MDNLFHPSFGSRPDRIVGRDDAIEQFIEGIKREPGHRDRATLILGQRGTGKTALLLQLADEAKARGFVAARVTSGEDMLEEIIESIQLAGSEYISKKQTKIKGFSAGALGFSLGLTFSEEVRENYGFRTKLTLLCDRLAENGKGVILLVDEVQPNSDVMRTLSSTYQHLAGEGKNIAIVMAGLPHAVSDVLNDRVLTFLNRARKLHLSPLSLSDIIAYYSDAFRRGNRLITEDQIKRLTEATRGFPYLLQLIGYYVMELSAKGEALTDEGIESAIYAAQAELEADVFQPTLHELSRKDIDVLTTIARQGDGAVLVKDVLEDSQLTNSYFQQYRARLLASGVIASPRNGELVITVPYLAEYLRGTNK